MVQKTFVDLTATYALHKMKALHPTPADPVSIIPDRDLPPKPYVEDEAAKDALHGMTSYAAAGPHRMGVRYMSLIANSQLRLSPEVFGLRILSEVVEKLPAGEF